jgi:hypothetical protein
MLRFIEVVHKSLEYDAKTESCKSLSFLRETYINPDYIISMRENTSLKQKFVHEPPIEGMDENLSFTELTIYTSTPGTTKVIDVVGDPGELIKKHYRY